VHVLVVTVGVTVVSPSGPAPPPCCDAADSVAVVLPPSLDVTG
jgi:hypothetical protein